MTEDPEGFTSDSSASKACGRSMISELTVLLSSLREVGEDCDGRGYDEGVGSCERKEDRDFAEEDVAFGEDGREERLQDVKIIDGKVSESI